MLRARMRYIIPGFLTALDRRAPVSHRFIRTFIALVIALFFLAACIPVPAPGAAPIPGSDRDAAGRGATQTPDHPLHQRRARLAGRAEEQGRELNRRGGGDAGPLARAGRLHAGWPVPRAQRRRYVDGAGHLDVVQRRFRGRGDEPDGLSGGRGRQPRVRFRAGCAGPSCERRQVPVPLGQPRQERDDRAARLRPAVHRGRC